MKFIPVVVALLVTVGAWSPPASSLAATSGASLETSCSYERHYFGGGYNLWRVCTTESVADQVIQVDVEYTFLYTVYFV